MAEGFDPLRTDEDVEEILRLAVRESPSSGGTLRERLTESAQELGISEEALKRAESLWLANQERAISAEHEQSDRTLFRKLKIGDFFGHLGSYVAVNLFLFWIDVRTDGRLDWSVWSIAGWGIAILIHAFTVVFHGSDDEREFQRWRKKRYKKKED